MKISDFNRMPGYALALFFIVSPALILFSSPCFSEHGRTPPADKNAPLHVVSDKMIAQKDTSMVEFIGNVKATREDSVLLADAVKVFFNENAGKKDNTAQSDVKKIISTGHVRYTLGDRKAFADKAVYTAKDDTLVLTGKSPKLVTGNSFVTGKKITLLRQQDKVIVESDGRQRVEALFNPEDNLTDKQE